MVDEIESLERRIRAFSEFSSEPPGLPGVARFACAGGGADRISEDRRTPKCSYAVEVAENTPSALADQDLVKGILVNLLENAAEAAGEGGQILARVRAIDDRVAIEVHDSGPGLSELARTSLFQPTISFKKRGMGLGLSIARKSALLSGGDILLIAGELGGAVSASCCPRQECQRSETMPSRRILVVDDEENIGRSLRMILEREGYQVNAVRSAARVARASRARAASIFSCSTSVCPMPAASICCGNCRRTKSPRRSIMISGHATIARRRGSHARRRIRLPREAAGPRPRDGRG